MITFLAHVHIFDATPVFLSCYGDHGGVGWGGDGIMSVLTALQLYRNDGSRGTLSIAPKDAFVPENLTWLD